MICSRCSKKLLPEEEIFIQGKYDNFFDTVVCFSCIKELKITDYFPNINFIDSGDIS